jgi:Flp pilus assembly protein TadG
MHPSRPRRGERGTASVEFVALLPVLLLVLLGLVESARAWLTLELVTAAAREGVRAAVVAPADQVSTFGAARIDAILGAGNWTGSVTCSATPCAPDAQVTATVNVTFQTVVPAILPWFSAMPISQTAIMRYE